MEEDQELRYKFLEMLEFFKTEKLYMADYVARINQRSPGLIAGNLVNDPKFFNFLCLIIIDFICSAYGEDLKNIPDRFMDSLLL
jgi:hypothetical protein